MTVRIRRAKRTDFVIAFYNAQRSVTRHAWFRDPISAREMRRDCQSCPMSVDPLRGRDIRAGRPLIFKRVFSARRLPEWPLPRFTGQQGFIFSI